MSTANGLGAANTSSRERASLEEQYQRQQCLPQLPTSSHLPAHHHLRPLALQAACDNHHGPCLTWLPQFRLDSHSSPCASRNLRGLLAPMSSTKWSRGSEWRRWDPHLHAPGTLLSDGFEGGWEDYLERIETATPR